MDVDLKPEMRSDKKMLVPLTQSLYVPGLLSDVQKVIVDVGTGYFVDMVCSALKKLVKTQLQCTQIKRSQHQDVKDANAFYTRKTAFIKESMDKLEVTINQKQDQRGAVMEVIQTKLSMIQKESQAARQATASSKGPAIAMASA